MRWNSEHPLLAGLDGKLSDELDSYSYFLVGFDVSDS